MTDGVSEQGSGSGADGESRSMVGHYAMRVARDAALALRIRAGDDEAYTELYNLYWASLCRAAASVVGDEAPDVVQRVFLKIWLKRERWTVRATVVAYLFTAVRNRALELIGEDKHRRCNERHFADGSRRLDRADRQREDESPDWIAEIDEQIAAIFASGEARAMRGDVEHALNAAVVAMSPRCREVFTMYWEMQPEHAFSYREIGKALGMSSSTVRQHLIKARGILEESLERAGWVNVLKRQSTCAREGGQDAA